MCPFGSNFSHLSVPLKVVHPWGQSCFGKLTVFHFLSYGIETRRQHSCGHLVGELCGDLCHSIQAVHYSFTPTRQTNSWNRIDQGDHWVPLIWLSLRPSEVVDELRQVLNVNREGLSLRLPLKHQRMEIPYQAELADVYQLFERHRAGTSLIDKATRTRQSVGAPPQPPLRSCRPETRRMVSTEPNSPRPNLCADGRPSARSGHATSAHTVLNRPMF